MSRMRSARRARREQLQKLALERQRAAAAVADLRAQYRAAPLPPLLLAAGAGWLLGRHGSAWRPPLAWLYPGVRWGMLVARGWLA